MTATPSRPASLRIRVPASTSNLGPGFDLLGVALSLYLDVEVSTVPGAGPHRFEALEGTAHSWPSASEENVLLHALRLAPLPEDVHFRIRAHSEIPVARGLGSSGSAVIAGLLLGEALAGIERTTSERLRDAIAIEKHPDNVTASLLGGLTLCHPNAGPGGAPIAFSARVSESIGWAVAWPEVAVPTQEARAVLPSNVPFAHAVENPRRLALLLEGLEHGDPDLLRAGAVDRLHVPYRLRIIPGAESAIDAAGGAGAWVVTISGSGSSLVALGPPERMEDVAAAMGLAFEKTTGGGTAKVVEVVRTSPELTRSDAGDPEAS